MKLIFGLLLVLAGCTDSSYEECVFNHVEDARTPFAASIIEDICKEKFSHNADTAQWQIWAVVAAVACVWWLFSSRMLDTEKTARKLRSLIMYVTAICVLLSMLTITFALFKSIQTNQSSAAISLPEFDPNYGVKHDQSTRTSSANTPAGGGYDYSVLLNDSKELNQSHDDDNSEYISTDPSAGLLEQSTDRSTEESIRTKEGKPFLRFSGTDGVVAFILVMLLILYKKNQLKSLRIFRGVCGFLFAIQFSGLFPAFTWFQNISAITDYMLLILVIKLNALIVFGFLFFWLRKKINFLHQKATGCDTLLLATKWTL